jgi:hypothetical protein
MYRTERQIKKCWEMMMMVVVVVVVMNNNV